MRGRRSTAGIAIITAISFMVVTLAFISTAFIVSISNTRLSGDTVFTTKAQLAAQAGIDEAILRVWHAATEDINATGAISGRRDIPDYRIYWQDITQRSPYTWNANAELLGDVDVDGFPIFGDPISFSGEVDDGTGSVVSYEVTIERRDDTLESSTLRITSTGTLPNGSQRRLQQELNVAYPPFQLDFALLTDFVNCTFCHSAFVSIEMGYDEDVGMANEEFLVDLTDRNDRIAATEGKQRIRVAGLRDMEISTGWKYLNTLVAGTIYSRGPQNIMRTQGLGGRKGPKANVWGPVYNGGSPLISDEDWEGFRPDQANLSEDELLECTVSQADGNAGCNERFARFYSNYPLERQGSAPPVDGVIPAVQQFPSPIKDLDGNRRIDNNEWSQVMANRTLGDLNGAAEIWFSATDANGVPNGGGDLDLPFLVRGQTPNIPNLSAVNNPTTTPQRGITGNLILIGTDTQPIEIDGTIYIDGDLVIQGPIDPGNRGLFIVRNNIYIVGDVVYDCNGNAAGTDCAYTQPNTLPRLGFVAGGMMVLGDPNQSQNTKGFPNGFNSRGGSMPIQGEFFAFNEKQYQTYEETRQAGASTLANSFVPRYYLYREGDEIPMRCNFEGDDINGDNRGTVVECRDFVRISPNNGGDKLEMRENIPCIPGQVDVFEGNQPNCIMIPDPVDPVNNPPTQIAIDVNGNGTFDGPDIPVRDLNEPIAANDGNFTNYITTITGGGGPFNWNTESDDKVGQIPVEQDPNTRAALTIGQIFVRDSGGNRIVDNSGNDVEPAYIFMSPSNSWLAPTNDFNGNGFADNTDVSLEAIDNMFSRQNAIAALEVLSGFWVEYGLDNGRTNNDERPLRIDGLLFTNNAIVSFLPRSRSHTDGTFILNGSIISYETGLLIYGGGGGLDNDCSHGSNETNMFNTGHWMCIGLRLQYDRRLPSLIDVRIEVPVLLRSRSQWLEITN